MCIPATDCIDRKVQCSSAVRAPLPISGAQKPHKTRYSKRHVHERATSQIASQAPLCVLEVNLTTSQTKLHLLSDRCAMCGLILKFFLVPC